MPRVIAGSARGLKLQSVPGAGTRPILDRVKESLFSIIGHRIHGAQFLDLYAGTGSVGIEALSRGAGSATFVEQEPRACRVIRVNLQRTRLQARAQLLRRDVFRLLERPPARAYDIIFLAPPQYQELWWRTLEALEAQPAWRTLEAQVIVQIDPVEYASAPPFEHLRLHDERRYGRTMLLFYALSAD